MAEVRKWEVVDMTLPEGSNIILAHSHFIKTVEDVYEALVTSSPLLEFGIAFCEASGPCLIRYDGNAEELIQKAVENAERLAAGHTLVVLIRKGYPVNVLDRIKAVQEVCRVYAATANPLQVLVFETNQGRGIAGVVDGFPSKGIETAEDVVDRKTLLREVIGYKR
ncbi:adenosine-specific kinase [Aminithiophilus ramosus]|uniref:Adenosine-specific kinase n=2 Tax=Synergistales TaxID=649776 RepID=A0A9Q7EW72_9BACT|nr:adenosine-specific kinase [Aminithiophilus ramosus]QTX31450.1 adenosine-specific kinase [Aminithiophilus ramosus]QVL35253.1 adenosine-specific kinase [Synergistota bacterium]